MPRAAAAAPLELFTEIGGPEGGQAGRRGCPQRADTRTQTHTHSQTDRWAAPRPSADLRFGFGLVSGVMLGARGQIVSSRHRHMLLFWRAHCYPFILEDFDMFLCLKYSTSKNSQYCYSTAVVFVLEAVIEVKWQFKKDSRHIWTMSVSHVPVLLLHNSVK